MSALVSPSEIHRFSDAEYHRLVESGGFLRDTHVELIEGWVVDLSPKSPEHENAVDWLIDWLTSTLDLARYRFSVTRPLALGDSEPEPDVAIVEREAPTRTHPSRARLVIEVAISSRDRDLRAKPVVYAPGVDEYWVVDLEGRCIVVHRDPADGAYRDVATHPRGESLTPQAVTLANVPLDSDALFAAAFAEPA